MDSRVRTEHCLQHDRISESKRELAKQISVQTVDEQREYAQFPATE